MTVSKFQKQIIAEKYKYFNLRNKNIKIKKKKFFVEHLFVLVELGCLD